MLASDMDDYKSLLKYTCFLILGVISVILCMTASKDWSTYNDHLFGYYSVHTSWNDMFRSVSFFREPLYFFSAKFFGELIGFPVFIGVTTIILLMVKLHFLSKMIDNVWVGCFLYVSLYLFLFESTQLRVAYATTFIFIAFYFLQQGKFGRSALMVLLASQLHLTSLVFLVIFPIYLVPRCYYFVMGVFAISPLFVALKISIYYLIFQFASVFTDKYQLYEIEKDLQQQNSTGMFLYFIGFFYLVIGSSSYFLRKRLQTDRFDGTIAALAMLGVIAMCLLHDHVAVAARFGELLMVSLVLLLSWLFFQFNDRGVRVGQFAIIVTSLCYGAARFLYLFPSLVHG